MEGHGDPSQPRRFEPSVSPARSADVSDVSAPETLADLALTQVEPSQEAAAPQRAHGLLRQAQLLRHPVGVAERHEV